MALSGPIALSATVNGQPGMVLPSSLSSIPITGATKFFLPKAGSTTITAMAGDLTGTSAAFTVAPGAAVSFAWSPISTPVVPDVARAVSLSAADSFGNAVPSFSGTADIGAVAQTRLAAVGTSTGDVSYALNPAFKRSRAQILVHSGALGGAGRIHDLSLELLTAPTRPYDELTIRLKHTAQHFAPSSWDDSGWTVVRHGAWLPSGSGWVTIPFQVPFDYDGTSNLYVDVSFVNDSTAGQVLCQATYVSGFYSYYAGTNDASYGLPTEWSGTSPPASVYYRPNLRLGFGTNIAVSPATTGVFVNGAWNGDVTMTGATPARVTLRATGGGAFGASGEFELGLFPPSAPVLGDEPNFTPGTINTLTWSSVPLAGSYYVEASTNMYFESNITGSGWVTGTSHTFTLSDGTYYFRVKARRGEDTSVVGDWSNTALSIQDSIGPQILVNGLSGDSGGTLSTMRSSLIISGTTSDFAGVASVTVGGAAAAGDYNWSSVVNTPASGSAPVVIVSTDSVGNQSTRIITLVRIADVNADGLPDEWQQSTGLFGGGVPPADAAPGADPDHDGFTNFMEFARGRNPLLADAVAPSVSRVPGFLFTPASTVFEYDRRSGVSDLLFEVQSSTDLAAWPPVSNTETVTPNLDGITEHVSVSISDGGGLILSGGGGLLGGGGGIIINPPAPPPQKYFRLHVSSRP